jgi:hypothetical protein
MPALQESHSREKFPHCSEGHCPNLKNGLLSEVGASAPTKSVIGKGVLTPEASGAKAHKIGNGNVRAEARTSTYSRIFQT